MERYFSRTVDRSLESVRNNTGINQSVTARPFATGNPSSSIVPMNFSMNAGHMHSSQNIGHEGGGHISNASGISSNNGISSGSPSYWSSVQAIGSSSGKKRKAPEGSIKRVQQCHLFSQYTAASPSGASQRTSSYNQLNSSSSQYAGTGSSMQLNSRSENVCVQQVGLTSDESSFFEALRSRLRAIGATYGGSGSFAVPLVPPNSKGTGTSEPLNSRGGNDWVQKVGMSSQYPVAVLNGASPRTGSSGQLVPRSGIDTRALDVISPPNTSGNAGSSRNSTMSSHYPVEFETAIASTPSSSVIQDSMTVYPPTNEFPQPFDDAELEGFLQTIELPDQPVHDFANLSSEELELFQKPPEQTVQESMQQITDVSVTNTPPSKMEPCSLCQLDYGMGDNVTILECWHDFHTDCIQKWVPTHSMKCPVCRMP